MLFYVAEAEAVFGRPFDAELDHEMQMTMFAVDRIATDEVMHKVASATSYVLDGKCIRTAKNRALHRHHAGQRHLGHFSRRRHPRGA